jgi:hypothetical protein
MAHAETDARADIFPVSCIMENPIEGALMVRVHCVAFAAMLLLAGCGSNAIRGSGNVTTESRNVQDFHKVALNGSGDLTIDQTGKEALTITADDNLLPYLTSDVSHNELVLDRKNRTSVDPSKTIEYKLEVGKLEQISVAGEGVITAKGIVSDHLELIGSGSTKSTLSGQVDRLEIVVTGEGEYQAGDLKSKDVKITITGDGKAVVAASAKLEVTIIGQGSVEYIGDPSVTQTITGSGTIKKRGG